MACETAGDRAADELNTGPHLSTSESQRGVRTELIIAHRPVGPKGYAMSFMSMTPGQVQGAAQDLAGIHSSLAEAATAAAAPTTSVVAAGQDEISVMVAALFGGLGDRFQAFSADAQAFHAQFVALMHGGANTYLGTEIANAGQALLGGGA